MPVLVPDRDAEDALFRQQFRAIGARPMRQASSMICRNSVP
jgi:hypothetical protein